MAICPYNVLPLHFGTVLDGVANEYTFIIRNRRIFMPMLSYRLIL